MLKDFVAKAAPVNGAPAYSLTLVSETPVSYYSGMLPGSVAGLYTEDDIKVQLAPLAAWCNAEFISQRVKKVIASANQLELENGEKVNYDVLALNVGSKTKDTMDVKGVWEHALTTRPINDLLPKIVKLEGELQAKGIIPSVVVCGAGAAGTELSFAFKARWSKLFGQEISVKLVASHGQAVHTECEQTRSIIAQTLAKKGIELIGNAIVSEIKPEGVLLADGRMIECNVPIWATGAEPQGVTAQSDLDLLKGYFRVNNLMQSTSHPNVFAGGDCVTIEDYADKPYPTKAGVFAVREGPIIAQNVMKYLTEEPLVPYVPQQGFLSLMMTGDGSCIGSKLGIGFHGKWVWRMKDHIDMSFMNLFDPKLLFHDYEKQGTKEPIEDAHEWDEATQKALAEAKEKVA